MKLLFGFIALVLVSGCDGGASPGPPDLYFASLCGRPGDPGNPLGVGRFCSEQSDCRNNGQAGLCTAVADPQRFFCTMTCLGDGGADACGEGAACACSGIGCACVPKPCLGP
jgi:hypothetical protein